MRVIAGVARSLPLKCPKGLDTRPTTDRIKETLFNMLQPYTQGSVFVDMFSGSGAIGIEALSRGAKKAYFIDNGANALSCIQENLLFTKLADKAVVLKQDAVSALGSIFEKEADIIFMDAPYGLDLEKQVLSAMREYRYVTEDTLIIVEAEAGTDFSYAEALGYQVVKEKIYKSNKHVFLKIAG